MSLGHKGARPVKLLGEPILHSLGRQKKKRRKKYAKPTNTRKSEFRKLDMLKPRLADYPDHPVTRYPTQQLR